MCVCDVGRIEAVRQSESLPRARECGRFLGRMESAVERVDATSERRLTCSGRLDVWKGHRIFAKEALFRGGRLLKTGQLRRLTRAV